MNCIIIFATGLITKNKNNFLKTIISSSIGALYAIGKYITNNEIFSNILIQIGLAFTMVYIAFSPQNLKGLFKYTVVFYLTSFVFGGSAYALLYYLKPQEIIYNNGLLTGTYPIKIAFLGAILGIIILKLSFKLIKNRFSKNEMFCELNIGYRNKTTDVRAIIDSGNLLKEPITGASVAVVEKSNLYEIIENAILDNLEKIIYGQYEVVDKDYMSRFRLIPFSSLGKQNGMLLGFKPDFLEVEFDGNKTQLNNIIIGIYEGEIFKEKKYSGIIGLDVFENENTSNEIRLINSKSN